MSDLQTRIAASFDKQSLMSTFGAHLTRVAPGEAVIRAPLGAGVLQQQGLAHGGLVFALGDSAAGYAGLTCVPEDQEVVTIEMKINFLAPGRGDFVEARGRILKPGRRLIAVAADVFAMTEGTDPKHIAALQGSLMPVPIS